MLGVLLGFAAFVLLFRYARPFARHTHVKLAIEILAMLAFLTAVLVAAGGVRSPLVNLYLLPIVTAALALGKRAAALVVVLVCACYPLVGVLTDGRRQPRRASSRSQPSACSRRSCSWRSRRRCSSTTSTRPSAASARCRIATS